MSGPSDDVLAQIYDIREAAAYLGLSVPAVKDHIYKIKDLAPDRLVGHSVIFTRRTLDDFQTRKRPAHRPVNRPM